MIAFRQIQEVKSGAVTVALPADFTAQKVEVIVLSIDDSSGGVQELQNFLLMAPTLSNDELQKYETAREWMSQWNVNEF